MGYKLTNSYKKIQIKTIVLKAKIESKSFV